MPASIHGAFSAKLAQKGTNYFCCCHIDNLKNKMAQSRYSEFRFAAATAQSAKTTRITFH
jgi:hypothetical protein